MSDGMLKVNFGALHQAAADIQKAINTLESQLSQLEQDAAPLIATWDGAAMQAYTERQRAWTSASAHLQGVLSQIKGAMNESAADYLSTEQRAANLFG
jgi:WXG100 family type VII secretion target